MSNILDELKHKTTTNEVLRFAIDVYNSCIDEGSEDPIEDTLEQVEEAIWAHCKDDRQHEARMRSVKRLLSAYQEDV